jgi:hypothetical protein
MMRRFAGGIVVGLFATACGQPFDEDDGPLGCDLPEPCEVVTLHEMGSELDPRSAAECMYDVITSGESAHLRQEFITVSESYYDLYIRAGEPAVYVSQQCEFEGPCQEPEYWRCTFDAPEQLDCSMGDGAPRVCSGMVNWCNSMASIEPTCP